MIEKVSKLVILKDIVMDTYFLLKNGDKKNPKLPKYPNSTLTHKYQNTGYDKSRIINFTTGDSLETVYNFYKKRLPKDGWELQKNKPEEEKIEFLYSHPKRVFTLPPRPSRHGNRIYQSGLVFRSWYSLIITAKERNDLLQVEIKYKIIGRHDWPDNNF